MDPETKEVQGIPTGKKDYPGRGARYKTKRSMISQKRLAFSIIFIAEIINYILRKVSNLTCGIVNSVLHFLSIPFAETVKTGLRKLSILCCKKQSVLYLRRYDLSSFPI